jgi:hypothetical protein
MADEKNTWTKAFEYTATDPELSGKEKTEKIKELYRQKKEMSGDQPRSNEGRYNENEYHPNRKKRINLSRRLGSTSPADMEKAAEIKRAARRAAYAEASKKGLKTGLKAIPGVGVAMDLLDPTELGAAERMSDELKSDLNQMEEYKKGGLVGRGQGKAIKLKTTKFY